MYDGLSLPQRGVVVEGLDFPTRYDATAKCLFVECPRLGANIGLT